MLVLSRIKDEKVVIQTPEGNIEVMVLSVECGRVRLGFTGPKSVIIDREEVYNAKLLQSGQSVAGNASNAARKSAATDEPGRRRLR